LPFYDFCGFRSVAVNSVYKLQFFTFIQNKCHCINKQGEQILKISLSFDLQYNDSVTEKRQ